MINTEERDKIVNELMEQHPIVEQTKFNEFNISEKLQENTQLRIYYQQLYEHEKYIYNELLEKFEVLQGQRYDFYRFEYDRNLQKTEIESYYLPKDPKILKMKRILKKQEIRVDFFKLCMDSVEKLYWRMKNHVDNERS